MGSRMIVAGLAFLCGAAAAFGALPLFGPSVEADANKEYRLTAKEGPWLIYVATFRGDPDNVNPDQRPQVMAHKLVYELRSQYQFHAYVFYKSTEQLQKEKEQLEQELSQRYGGNAPTNKTIRVHHEYAVMVGNYKDMEDAKKALDQLKKETPKSVKGSSTAIAKPRKPGAIKEADADSVKVKVDEVKTQNPLAHGFVVHNPLRRREAPPQAQPQPKDSSSTFLSELNRAEPYNLLNCRQPYTLVVKVFTPTVRTQPSRPSVFDANRPVLDPNAGRELQAAAQQANQLAGLLRHKNMGYESYVWHTRNSSMVTVGSFKSPKDPELLKTQRLLAGMKVGGVELLPQPMPMEVPK